MVFFRFMRQCAVFSGVLRLLVFLPNIFETCVSASQTLNLLPKARVEKKPT